jgi:AcrR family transcriptional regulator
MFNNSLMSKSDETRQRITDIAIASFRARGYEKTTIRLIASEAGISVGNAYYYFPTKTHLVQQLYVDVQTEHTNRARAMFRGETDLATRFHLALMSGLDALMPYHSSAPGFLAAAISPMSAVNPLSDESKEAREIVQGLFREVVDGAVTPLPDNLREQLADVLWFAYLGLALFFVYDTSEGQKKTRRLADRSAGLLGSLLPLARLPFLRKPLADVLEIIREARA